MTENYTTQEVFEQQEIEQETKDQAKTALAVREKSPIAIDGKGLKLATIEDLYRFCQYVVASGLAPKDVRTPEQALIKVQHGWEVGLSPMASILGIALIPSKNFMKGRPTLYGDQLKGVVLASPVCEWITERIEGEGNEMVAICTSKRKGHPEQMETRFSVADAQQAGLTGKDGSWQTYPKRMLQLRARGFNLRDNFADILCGLVSAEEAMDYPTDEPQRIKQGDTVGANHLDTLADQAEAAELPEVEAKK